MKRKPVISLIAGLCAIFVITGCTASGQTADNSETETSVTETESIIEDADTEAETETESVIETELAEIIEDTSVTDTETTEPTDAAGTADTTSGYSYTEKSATMYAKSSVNVRDLPSTEGNRLGSLSTNQEVVVTGQCDETGWYRIQYNGGEGYVSNNYIVTEKVPVMSTTQTLVTGTQTSGEFSFDRAMAESIFAKVNAERKAAGTAELTWDESYYDIAVQRCYENDVHASMRNGTAENCQSGYGVTITADALHQSWHDSHGHYTNYMRSESTKGAVAVYTDGYSYVAYEVFDAGTGATPTDPNAWYTQNEYITSVTINGEVVYQKDNTATPAPQPAPDTNSNTSNSNTTSQKTEEEYIREWLEQNPDCDSVEVNGVIYER